MTEHPMIITSSVAEASAVKSLGEGLDVRRHLDIKPEDTAGRHVWALISSRSDDEWMAECDTGFCRECLKKGAASARCAILEDMPVDPREWKKAGLTLDILSDLFRRARPEELGEDEEVEAPKPRPFQFDWREFTADKFDDDDDPPEPILEGSLYRGDTGMIVAPGGTGKNYFAAQLGASLASGTSFFGLWGIPHAMRVLYVTAEEPQRVVKKKVRGSVDRLDISPAEKKAAKARYVGKSIVGLGGSPLVRPDGRGSLEKTEHIIDLHQLAASFQPDIIFLDHLSKLCPVNEIDNAALTVVCGFIEELAFVHRCAVLVLHHANKSGNSVFIHSRDDLYRSLDPSVVRGGTSLVANVRWTTIMAPFGEDFAPKVIGDAAIGENSGVYVVGRVAKKNEGAQESNFYLKHGCDGFFDMVEVGGEDSAVVDASTIVKEIKRRISNSEPPLSRFKGYEHLPKMGRRRYNAAVKKGLDLGWIHAIAKALGKGEILVLGDESAEGFESAQNAGTLHDDE